MTSAARELFTVVRDTDDVKTLAGTGNVKVTEFGQAYICDPDSQRGFRGKLRANAWPYISYANNYNDDITEGSIYVNGRSSGWKTTTAGAGFHIMQFLMPGSSDRFILPSHFAYSYTKTNERRVLGGTKIAEYIVFDHSLDPVVRTNIYTALRTKWFNDARTVRKFGNLTVGAGASLSIPWNDVVVTNCLLVGGSLTVGSVKMAAIRLTSVGANVSGNLTLEDGATVTVEIAEDATVASLRASSLTLVGGGKIVLAPQGRKRLTEGEIPLLTGNAFTVQADSEWTVDSSVLSGVTARLRIKNDGLYAVISRKSVALIVR